ncbi:Nrap protein [Cyathus striatus]|nr:Nrap protein [Cyathus striatus]
MAQNLKRKRATEAGPRKNRKVTEEDEQTESQYEDDNVDGSGDEGSEGEGEPMEQDDEEWGGLDESAADNKGAGSPEVNSGKAKKPPVGEELRLIKDASDLFKSSSFKLQIDALLPNVRPKASRIPPLDRFLHKLHTYLSGLPSIEPQHPLEAARKLKKKGIAIPYSLPHPTEDTNWKVAFEKPSEIILVGSWANKISVKPKDGLKFGVDMAVEMPNSLFQEKDYLNGRFFQKRAFYLATIASFIKSKNSNLNVDILYDSLQGDTRSTKLIIIPKKDDSEVDFTKLNAQICIIPVLSPNSPIPLHRLSPSHSNLRVTTSATSSEDPKSATHPATPLYNTALLRCLTPRAELLSTYTLKNESLAFADALTLLRIWANQRGYSEGSRLCVRGFEGKGPWWSALLGCLIFGEEPREKGKGSKRKPLGRGLSSYQLFRAALDFLAKHDFEKEPVFVKSKEGHRFSFEEYANAHEAVFVDSSLLVNLLAGVPLGSVELLKYDAQKTLETLNQTILSGDPFPDVFLTEQRDLPTRFDTVLRLDLSSLQPLKTSIQDTVDSGSPANATLSSLSSILRHGLGDRVKAVAILHPTSTPRPISQSDPTNPAIIYIGIVHNMQNAFRLVDHGPAAGEEDESVVQRFREFWGDKAELRRFKDGRIIESVVWEVKTADERAHVPSMVVQYLVKRHFGIQEDAVQVWQSSFDSVLRLPESISSLYVGSGMQTGFKGTMTAFDNLVRSIKALGDDLPLSLMSVSPVSEQLRYTNVFSPVPVPKSLVSLLPPNARYVGPIEIVFEFEKSSRWPDDLKAIQKIKLAFLERIASLLMRSIEGLRANVVVGDGVHTSEILDQSSLEIVTPEGWVFSVRIWHDREATLLDRILEGRDKVLPHLAPQFRQVTKDKEYYDAVEAKEVYTRRFIHAPRHHRAIAALSHHYAAFSGTVRLVKRWLASHWLLHGHISEEAVELICAKVFVAAGRDVAADTELEVTVHHLVPGSKERGFAAVVSFLRGWKWEEGLFVPLHGSTAVEAEIKAVASGAGVWTISTEFDKGGRMWTTHGPDLVAANRVQALASATWNFLHGMERGNLDVKALFIHPTQDYDVVVQLKPSVLPRYLHNIAVDPKLLSRQGKYANLAASDDDATARPGFDPARLLFNDLQRIYADTFKVFFDPFGGDKYGIVWDPSLKQPRPFRVLGGFSSVPVKKENEKAKDKGMVVLNEGAILSEIERLGMGLIKNLAIHV